MRAVVTGATGFVGKWLVDTLLEQGEEVMVLVRNTEAIPCSWKEKVLVVNATLDQIIDLCGMELPWKDADIFFHLAWAGTSGTERANTQLQLANVQHTCDAVRLAAKLGCERFANAGSIMEYEAMKYIPKDGALPGMGCIYSVAKLTADYMAKVVATQEKITYVNLIMSNIYGVGEKSARFVNTIMRKMLMNEEIPLTEGKQLYDFIYVEDAVAAMILAAKKGDANSSYYIGNVCQRPLKDFVQEMHAVLKSNAKLMFGAIPFGGVQLEYNEFDTSSLRKLGFEPRISFAEGVKRTKKWMLEVENEF